MARARLSKAIKVERRACHRGIELKKRPLIPKTIQIPEQKACPPRRRRVSFMRGLLWSKRRDLPMFRYRFHGSPILSNIHIANLHCSRVMPLARISMEDSRPLD